MDIQQSKFEEYFKSDLIYEVLGITTFEDYLSKYKPDFYLINTVPEDVIKEIAVVESLFCCAYINYLFIDESLSKLTRVLELALNLHFQNKTGYKWDDKEFACKYKKRDFNNLIDWTFENDIFDTDKDFIQIVRKYLRNSYAHPERHSFGGLIVSHWFSQLLIFLNELFEPVQLRNLRMERVLENKKTFDLFANSLCVLEYDNKRILIHHIEILFVNTIKDDEITYCCFSPLFDLNEITQSNYALHPRLFLMSITNITIQNSCLCCLDSNNTSVKLSINNKSENQNKYEAWNKQLFNIKEENRAIIQMNVNAQVEKYQQQIRQEYYHNLKI